MSPVEEIKNKLDIVEVLGGYVKLEKAGINYRARCPFHNEKTPSFFVSPSRQMWRCFGGCSEGGDMFSFIMKIEGMEFVDALRLLAEKAGITLKKQDPRIISERAKLYDIVAEAAEFFTNQLASTDTGKKVVTYLDKRGVHEKSIKDFQLGYALDSWQSLFSHLTQLGYKAEDIEKAGLVIKKTTDKYYDRFRKRIMFPITDISGKVVGFTGRIFEEPQSMGSSPAAKPGTVRYPAKSDAGRHLAKYMNSPETPTFNKGSILYGLDRAKLDIKKQDACVLVEGNLDVIMSHQAGVTNAVATSGTALTEWQLRIIRRYTDTLVISFDMDEGGENAALRGIDLAEAQGFNIKIVRLPEAKDPAEYIQKQPDEWQKRIGEAQSIYEYYLEYALKTYGTDEAYSKKKVAGFILPKLKRIPNKIEQAHWVAELAGRLKVTEEDIRYELDKVAVPAEREEHPVSGQKTQQKPRRELLEERLLLVLMNHPKKLALFKKSGLSLSLQGEEVIQYLGSKTKDQNVSPEVKELIDSLSLYSEYEKEQDIDYDEEIEFIIKELKTLSFKEELGKLSSDIQEAERTGDEKSARELLEKFQTISKGLVREGEPMG